MARIIFVVFVSAISVASVVAFFIYYSNFSLNILRPFLPVKCEKVYLSWQKFDGDPIIHLNGIRISKTCKAKSAKVSLNIDGIITRKHFLDKISVSGISVEIDASKQSAGKMFNVSGGRAKTKAVLFFLLNTKKISAKHVDILLINKNERYGWYDVDARLINTDNHIDLSIISNRKIDVSFRASYKKNVVQCDAKIKYAKVPLGLFIESASDIEMAGVAFAQFNLHDEKMVFNMRLNQKNGTKASVSGAENHPVQITDFDIKASGCEKKIRGEAFFNSYGAKWESKCTAIKENNSWQIVFDAKIEQGALAIENLMNLWPHGRASGGRSWISENFHGGAISGASCKIEFFSCTDNCLNADFKKVSGTLCIANVGISFLEKMPIIKGVTAESTYDDSHFDIQIKSGELEKQKIKSGRIIISNLDKDIQNIDINLFLHGPLRELLLTINMPRLGLLEGIPINSKESRGTEETNLRLAFPLLKDIFMKDVAISAASIIKNSAVSIKNIKIDSEKIDVNFLAGVLEIEGKSKIDSARCNWKMSRDAKKHTKLGIVIEDDSSMICKLVGCNSITEYVSGKINVLINYDSNKKDISGKICFKNASVKLPYVNFNKKVGEKLCANVSANFSNGYNIKKINMKCYGVMRGDGAITLGADGKPTNISMAFNNGIRENYVNDALMESIDIGAPVIDLREMSRDSAKKETVTEGHDTRGILIKAECNKLIMPNSTILNLRANLSGKRISSGGFFDMSKTFWKTGSVTGLVVSDKKSAKSKSSAKKCSISIKPISKKETSIVCNADGAGDILSAFGVSNKLKGGNLKIKATQSSDGEYKGEIKIKELEAKVPILAKIVTLASPTGFIDLFSKNLLFSVVRIKFAYHSSKFVIDKMVAKGLNLGFVMRGSIDLQNDNLSLRGSIVPAYFFNTLFSSIPIIGDILGGDDGIISTDFEISGPFDKICVNVSPLSSLAPNIIKQFFSVE